MKENKRQMQILEKSGKIERKPENGVGKKIPEHPTRKIR